MAEFTVLDVIPSVTSLILIVSSLALYFAYYLRTKYTYWERRGVPCVKPVQLFFGNTKDLIFQNVPAAFVFGRFYKELDGHKFGGFYQMTKPSVILRDPELIRTVFIKNFSNFHDRIADFAINEKMDPLSSNLLNLCGQRWKNVRYKLTPTFSSGKLRQMETLMKDCVCELDEYLTKATSGDSVAEDVQNVRELMAKFTTDVIGTCAFGLQCNSISDKDSEFRRIGRLIFTPTYRIHIRNLLRTLNPRLINLFKLKAFNPEVEVFFKSVLEQAVKHRESSAQKRNDFLQLMIDIQAEEKGQLQSNGHQQNDRQQHDQQSGVHIEKKEPNEKPAEKASETMRKYPVASVVARRCTESFQIPGSSIVIEKGTPVVISIYGLHHDPKYFPEPEKFLPERFREENKDVIVPGSYLPFGDGPRICIGMRFAMFEMKSVLSHLVSNYTFHPCEKTTIPLKFNRRSVLLTPVGGIWVQIKKRMKS